MSSTLSPNMQLIIPGVGSEAGPTYAEDVNASLTLVDSHDHSLGSGVQITPAGLNINANLSFQDNGATDLSNIVFVAQSSINTPLALYSKPGTESPPINDLWFNDGSGTPVQLTAGGLVNATIASLPGESFSGGTFFWKQGSGSTVPANFDIGSITIRPNTAATTFGITLSPPSSISSAYTLTLPTDPGSLSATSFLTMTSAGVINATVSTSGGITGSMIANGTIGTTKLAFDPSLHSQIFTSNTTWVVPAGVTKVMVIGAGGGGGGGGGGSFDGNIQPGAGGGGGAGGAVGVQMLDVTAGASISVTIGAGGAGGGHTNGTNTNGGNGTDGSSSTFGTLTFRGGAGGKGGPGGQTATTGLPPQPGKGATGSGGDGAYDFGTLSQVAQNGANSAYGLGGIGGTNNAGRGGGGGGASLGAGSNGGAGGNPGGVPSTAAANSGGGGGGGGGSDGAFPQSGGTGGSGSITVVWTGNT